MARKLKKKLPKAQFGLIDDVTKLGRKYLPKIFPKPIPPSVLSPMKTFKVGKNPALTFDDWRSYIETGNVQPAFEPFFSQKAGQHILPTFAPVDEFGTVGLTGDLVRKESNRFNNLVFDRGLMIAPAQGTGRKSVHFTGTGKPVPSHLMGNWDHVTTTFTLPMADAIRYNAMPRSTAPNDVYFYSPRQFVYPPSTKILTGDMELASNARGIGLDVNFNKELFKLNKQLNKIEELKNTPGTKYSYNESTSSGNFDSDKYNLYKKDREPLVRQVKALTDDWLTGLNLQGIDHLNPAYKLGFRDFDPNLRNDLLRNIRSSSESPYVHSESPEFKYYMEGLKDSSGLPLVKSRSQRIDENPSFIFDDVTMEQAKDPKYSLFDNARIYKGGYEKAGMVEPSQADLILYQKQIFSYPKEYVEKILANYDAKNFPKDGPYRKILENYIKDGSAGVKYNEGGSLAKAQDGTGSVAYSLTVPEVEVTESKKSLLDRIKGNPYLNFAWNTVNPFLLADNTLQALSIPSNLVRESIEGIGGKGDGKFNFGDIVPDIYNTTILDDDKKQQPVSDVLGVEGFFPSLVVDIATDPASYVGAGVVKNLIQKGGRKTVPNIIKALDKTTPGGGDMFQQIKLIADANPSAAKKLKLTSNKKIEKLIKNDPDRAQRIIDEALLDDNVKFSKANFLDNVKVVSKDRAADRFNYETAFGPGLPGVQFKNVESFINKLGDDGTTTLFRYGEGPLNTIQRGRGPKFGYYSADPFDVFRYDEMRRGLGPTNVYKIDLDNSLLTKYYKSKDFGKANVFDANTRFTEFEVPEFRINQSNLQNLGTIDDYRKYLRTLKQSGGELPKAQDGTGSLNPQYQAIIYYNPDDPNDYFTADLERMTPELNQRYGEGNWIARPIPNFAFTDEYSSLLKEQKENPFIIKHKKEMSALREKEDQIRYDIDKERKANNFDDYKTEKQMELEKQLQTLNEEIETLAAKRQPITYSDKDYYYNQTKGEYKLLDDAEFESEDHKNYIINSIERQNLERDKKDLLSSVDSTNKYFQDIKNLSPTGDIIIMQHGTAKVGPIMMSEAERDSFQYDQTPGITDTFAEVINENFDDPSGITCYMGMCKQSDSGQRLANATGMKVNVASGDQWSGYQTGFGDTFIDRFFGTGNTLIDPVTSQPYNYGYDTYGPFINEEGPDAVDEAFYENYLNNLNIFNENIIPENRQQGYFDYYNGGALPKAQVGRFLPSLKSITNPFGRFNFKINPYPVIPKSQLLIPGRTYGDVQHKIPSLISENQRTDTPGISSFIMPRGNLNYGKVFSDDMASRITTFMGEGQMLNEPFKLMDGNTRFWLGEQMGQNWDNFYRGLQFENKNLFPEISKFDLKLDYKPDGQLAWFKPDGTEYTDLIDLKQPFPSFIAKDKTSPETLFRGPRKIKDRADLENQFNIRNTAYHTVNITDGLRNNELIRSQAKKYGFNPDDDRELAMFLGTSPGGSGRRGGYLSPEGYDILFSGNDPKVTLQRYGNMRANPFTVKFNLLDANVTEPGGGVSLNADGANKMPVGSHGFNETDLGLYDRISAFDTKNTDFLKFGIANPFEFDPNLHKLSKGEPSMFKFKQGLNPDDYQGLIINPNTLHVPGLTQTNLIFGKENIPVRAPRDIFTPDEIFKGKKEYGGQTPWLALDDTPDRTYEDGGAVRTSLSEYQNGGGPNYNKMLIQFIKDQEAGMEYMKAKNSAVMKPDGSGYYKRYEDGKFYPYYHQNSDGTFEKEATIAYGTKGADIFDLYKEGISVPEAEEQLNKSLNNAYRKTKIYVDANYGEGFYDNLTDQKKAMLADFTYNLGRLSKYPNFAEGILTDNTDLALAEYIRGEQEGGAKLARNEAYLETFLQPWVDQTLERKKKEEEEEKLRLLNQKRDNIMEEKYSSWYSPFVPNSIENLFKQNYDWEDQYWKDKGITTYQDGGEDGKKYVSPYEKYGGIDEYSKMLNFLSYQQALKSGNKTMSDFYSDQYGFGDMSFDDMYAQARKIYEIGLNNPDDNISQRLIGRMVDSEGRPEFQYKGQPYNPYSYTELATDKYRQIQDEIANRIEGILGNPDKQNTQYTRTINPTSGKYEYEPVTVPTGASGRFPVGALPPMALSEDVFRNEGDLQKYIDEQFPEGSKERAFIDANPEVKKNWESLVAAYEQQRPHIVYGNELQLFQHIFDPESNKYIHNFTGDNKRYIELQQKRCAEIKQKFPTYNCDTGEIEGSDPYGAVIKADTRSDWQRDRDRKHQEMIEYNMQNKIPPNMMFMVQSSPGLSSMYNQAQRTGDYSAINQQVINFSPSNPENLALGATTIAGGPILRGIGNLLKTPAGRFVPKLFNPNVARPVTVGDAINVGFGAYGTAKHGPSMISNLMEGEYGDAAMDLGNLALYNIGVPSSLSAFNRGMNFGKVFPGQFTKSVVPQRNITPSTLDAFKTKYPNLNPSLSPQQYEGFAAFSQQLPNYSLINPIRTTFPGTQRFIGQPKLTQSGFDNVFKNLNQGATIVK